MVSYDYAVKYFGSPEKYAEAIKQREAAGQPLSDPAAAAAFKAANPQLFAPTGSQGGGGGGGGGTASSGSYQQVLSSYFGGDPATYAAEVQRKLTTGQQFTDPAAAVAFMQAYPQYFQQAQPVVQQPNVQPQVQPQIVRGMTRDELQAILGELRQPLENRYNYLYEQLQRDLLAQMPKAPQLTPEQMLAQAQQYANIHVDPQVQALQRALEQYQANAEAQQRAIEAAYATIPQQTQQMLDEARQAALESAIARGAGRSGVVDWQTEKLSAPIMTAAQQAEAQRAASLTDVADQLALQQQQAQTQLQQLEKMRGDLTQQYMQQLQDQGYIRSVEDWQNAWSAASQMAEMAMSANQANMQTGIGLLNAIALGQMPWPDLNAGTSSGTTAATSTVSGAVAPLTGGGNDLVPVRGYVEGWGGSVSYDPTTGEVIVNGRRFKPSDVGGYIQNGVAYAPRSYLTQLLGG